MLRTKLAVSLFVRAQLRDEQLVLLLELAVEPMQVIVKPSGIEPSDTMTALPESNNRVERRVGTSMCDQILRGRCREEGRAVYRPVVGSGPCGLAARVRLRLCRLRLCKWMGQPRGPGVSAAVLAAQVLFQQTLLESPWLVLVSPLHH